MIDKEKFKAGLRETVDTIVFVVADHGHHNVVNLFIKDYPDIEECLLRNTSLEPRAVNFFIKPDKKEQSKRIYHGISGKNDRT